MKKLGINKGVPEFENSDVAVLLDVRTEEEYREDHVPGSKKHKSQKDKHSYFGSRE